MEKHSEHTPQTSTADHEKVVLKDYQEHHTATRANYVCGRYRRNHCKTALQIASLGQPVSQPLIMKASHQVEEIRAVSKRKEQTTSCTDKAARPCKGGFQGRSYIIS